MKKVVLSVLLAASILAGNTAFARGKDKDPVKTERKTRKQDDKLEKMKTELSLRDDQMPQVKQAILEHRNAIQSIHAEKNADKQVQRDKIKAANQAFQLKMKSILNPEQYRKFEQMVKEKKEAKKQRHKGKHKGQKKSK